MECLIEGTKSYHRTLTIAGSDSGGGAGIQADIKTFSALGCYGMSVITALTAQNTSQVTSIHPVPPEFIAEQIDAVVSDIGADAVKIGMLHSVEVIQVVADSIKRHNIKKIILDPVMFAKSGDRLIRDDAVEALAKHLVPLATVLTPNLPEASELLKRSIKNRDHMDVCAIALCEMGPDTVVIKGGHLDIGGSDDMVATREANGEITTHWLGQRRVDTPNVHGTGCTFSSAITAWMARGETPLDAIHKAKEFISEALLSGSEYRIGKGRGPSNPFYNFWKQEEGTQ